MFEIWDHSSYEGLKLAIKFLFFSSQVPSSFWTLLKIYYGESIIIGPLKSKDPPQVIHIDTLVILCVGTYMGNSL